MKKSVIFTCVILFLIIDSHAQFSRYIVFLKHKGATTHTLANPLSYLTQRAIDRRQRFSIAIDSTDIPVPSAYVNQIGAVQNVTVLNVSRWLNAVTIQTTDANAITTINALPFVQSTTAIALRQSPSAPREEPITDLPLARGEGMQGDFFNYGANSFNEIHLQKGEFLHNIGLRGQGMQIAILDGGFFNYTTLDAMDSIITNGQVLSTWDFVNNEASVVEDNAHGMMCLSTIAANIPGQFVGKAPKANFHLFKTEDVASEYPIETFNWVCGAERADSSGADIISTSLGYNTFDNPAFDFTYSDMNGNTTLCTKGADLAAKKGILVFAAVGNYGTAPWKFLAAPADADSVVAVGAVNSAGAIWPSSSYGPSADGRIKPDVASVGFTAVIQNANNTIGSGNGTSFACPNMAGLGTCLWQGFPEFNNMRVIAALKQAGSISSSPNDRIGYGIPDMKIAFSDLLIQYATSTLNVNTCNASLSWSTKDVSAMRFEIERKAPGETNYTKIGDVTAQAGTILSIHNYNFSDQLTNTIAGTISYRVRQVIDTASASFTAVYIDTANFVLISACTTTATVDPVTSGNFITIAPNPVNNGVALVNIQTINAVPDLHIDVYDMDGRLLHQKKTSKPPGKLIVAVPMQQWAIGNYLVRVYNGSKLIGTVSALKL